MHDKAELHDDALIEFVEATAWYAERDADIAEDFAREVEGALQMRRRPGYWKDRG